MSTPAAKPAIAIPEGPRWWYLILAVLIMCMMSGVQYAWTLFARPMTEHLAVSLAAVQTAFTLSQVIQSVSQPGGGYFVDRFGPKIVLIVGGCMVGIGWVCMGMADSLPMLYCLYTLAGAGVGICYGIAINTANRWFPDKRGLASGFTAAGYGLGVVPFLPVITSLIQGGGVGQAFMYTGVIMGGVTIVIAFLIRFPAGQAKKVIVATEKDFNSNEMLRTPQFWVLWFSFFSVNFGFLLLVANSAPFARSLGTMSAGVIAIAVSIQNLLNGGCRPFWGAVSDKIGRYRTMSVMFGINACCLFAFPHVAQIGVPFFMIILGITFFTSGGSYALFPPTNSDIFGTAYSARNYGFFWAAKAVASIFGGGIGAAVATNFGWTAAFTITGCTSTIAFLLATFVIPRMGPPKKRKPVQEVAGAAA